MGRTCRCSAVARNGIEICGGRRCTEQKKSNALLAKRKSFEQLFSLSFFLTYLLRLRSRPNVRLRHDRQQRIRSLPFRFRREMFRRENRSAVVDHLADFLLCNQARNLRDENFPRFVVLVWKMAERCRFWEEAVGGNVVRSQGGRGGEEGDSRGGHDVWLGGCGLLMGGGWWMVDVVRSARGRWCWRDRCVFFC